MTEERKVIVSTKDGKVKIDIPGEESQCSVDMENIMTHMEGFVQEERINRSPREKEEVVVNVN